MVGRFSRVRWFAFLSTVLLVLSAYGCDQLGGSKSKKSDRSSKHDDDDDDDDKPSKKKKKKKKSSDDDEEDDGEKPSTSATATATAEAPPPPPPQPTDEYPNAPSCSRYMRMMACLIAKMPPDSRASMEQSVAQMRDAFKQLGTQAESTCQQAMSSTESAASQLGCSGAAIGPSTPPSSPSTPTGPSDKPSDDEFDEGRDVTVRGTAKLGCKSVMVREWLRVSCKGKNFTGGTPTKVAITLPGHRDEVASTRSGTMSVIVRFVEATNVEATFTWTDRTHVLKVYWPPGSPEPPAKGVFIGVD